MYVLQPRYMPTVFGSVLSNALTIFVVLSKIHIGNGAVPMTDFFPYLTQDAHTLASLNVGDYLKHVQLGFSFPYFGVNYTRIVVVEKEYVRLGDKGYQATPSLECNTSHVYPAIIPLRSVVELTKSGSITYGVFKNRTLFRQLSNNILEFFALDVSLTSGFVVSYINLTNVYLGSSTFQMIMTTDGIYSFVIFQYNQLSDFSGWGLFSVGFTNHNKSAYLLYLWCRDKTYKQLLNESNVSVPGKWMFRVDSNSLVSPIVVEFLQKQEHQPRIVYLVRKKYLLTEIEYTGNIAQSELALLGVSCLFGNLPEDSTKGIMLPELSGILCRIPSRFDTGFVAAKMIIRLKVKSAVLARTVNASLYLAETTTTELVNRNTLEDSTNFPIFPMPEDLTHRVTAEQHFQPDILPTQEESMEESAEESVEEITINTTKNPPIQIPKQYKQIRIEPILVSVYGNMPLLLHATPLLDIPNKVICTFFEITNVFRRSKGMTLSSNDSVIVCPVPFLTTFGKISLEVQLFYEFYKTEILFGNFYAQRDTDTIHTNSENFASIQIHEETRNMITLQQLGMNATWKNPFLKPQIAQYFGETPTYKELVVYGYDGTNWDNGIVIASSSQNSTFNVSLEHEEIIFDTLLLSAFGIRETLVTNSGQNITGVTFLKTNESFWLLQNLKNLTGYINLESKFQNHCKKALVIQQNRFSTTPTPCPETTKQAISDWMFIQDTTLIMHDENLDSFTKAVPSRSGEGIQCLYNTNGNLSSLSHKQHYSSTFWRNHWSYYLADFSPFIYCCGLQRNSESCQNFYSSERGYPPEGLNEKRYSDPKFALAVSTAKIFPFQGRSIPIESIGEFWALKYNNQNEANQSTRSSYESFKLQFRVEEYIDLKGESKGVPVTTTVAFVDREHNSNFAIQISREQNQFRIQVNEREPYFIFPLSEMSEEFSSNHTLYFDQATIKHTPSVHQLLATFKSGFSVKLYLTGDNEMGLSFIVSASETQLQNSVGLLAVKPIVESTVEDTEIVNAWIVSETDTIFLYTVENPRSIYHRSDVSLRVPPLLNLQIGETVNPGLEGVLDYLATGSESIGNSTRMIHEEYSLLKTAFKK